MPRSKKRKKKSSKSDSSASPRPRRSRKTAPPLDAAPGDAGVTSNPSSSATHPPGDSTGLVDETNPSQSPSFEVDSDDDRRGYMAGGSKSDESSSEGDPSPKSRFWRHSPTNSDSPRFPPNPPRDLAVKPIASPTISRVTVRDDSNDPLWGSNPGDNLSSVPPLADDTTSQDVDVAGSANPGANGSSPTKPVGSHEDPVENQSRKPVLPGGPSPQIERSDSTTALLNEPIFRSDHSEEHIQSRIEAERRIDQDELDRASQALKRAESLLSKSSDYDPPKGETTAIRTAQLITSVSSSLSQDFEDSASSGQPQSVAVVSKLSETDSEFAARTGTKPKRSQFPPSNVSSSQEQVSGDVDSTVSKKNPLGKPAKPTDILPNRAPDVVNLRRVERDDMKRTNRSVSRIRKELRTSVAKFELHRSSRKASEGTPDKQTVPNPSNSPSKQDGHDVDSPRRSRSRRRSKETHRRDRSRSPQTRRTLAGSDLPGRRHLSLSSRPPIVHRETAHHCVPASQRIDRATSPSTPSEADISVSTSTEDLWASDFSDSSILSLIRAAEESRIWDNGPFSEADANALLLATSKAVSPVLRRMLKAGSLPSSFHLHLNVPRPRKLGDFIPGGNISQNKNRVVTGNKRQNSRAKSVRISTNSNSYHTYSSFQDNTMKSPVFNPQGDTSLVPETPPAAPASSATANNSADPATRPVGEGDPTNRSVSSGSATSETSSDSSGSGSTNSSREEADLLDEDIEEMDTGSPVDTRNVDELLADDEADGSPVASGSQDVAKKVLDVVAATPTVSVQVPGTAQHKYTVLKDKVAGENADRDNAGLAEQRRQASTPSSQTNGLSLHTSDEDRRFVNDFKIPKRPVPHSSIVDEDGNPVSDWNALVNEELDGPENDNEVDDDHTMEHDGPTLPSNSDGTPANPVGAAGGATPPRSPLHTGDPSGSSMDGQGRRGVKSSSPKKASSHTPDEVPPQKDSSSKLWLEALVDRCPEEDDFTAFLTEFTMADLPKVSTHFNRKAHRLEIWCTSPQDHEQVREWLQSSGLADTYRVSSDKIRPIFTMGLKFKLGFESLEARWLCEVAKLPSDPLLLTPADLQFGRVVGTRQEVHPSPNLLTYAKEHARRIAAKHPTPYEHILPFKTQNVPILYSAVAKLQGRQHGSSSAHPKTWASVAKQPASNNKSSPAGGKFNSSGSGSNEQPKKKNRKRKQSHKTPEVPDTVDLRHKISRPAPTGSHEALNRFLPGVKVADNQEWTGPVGKNGKVAKQPAKRPAKRRTKQAAKQTVQQPPTSPSSPSLGLLPSSRPQKTARPLQDVSSDHQVQAFFAGMTLDKEVIYWTRTLRAHKVIVETGEKGNHRRPLYGLGPRAHDYHKLHCFRDLIISGRVGVDNWVFVDKHPELPYPTNYPTLPKSPRVKKAANTGRDSSPSSKSSAANPGRGGLAAPVKNAAKPGRKSSSSTPSSAANTGRKDAPTKPKASNKTDSASNSKSPASNSKRKSSDSKQKVTAGTKKQVGPPQYQDPRDIDQRTGNARTKPARARQLPHRHLWQPIDIVLGKHVAEVPKDSWYQFLVDCQILQIVDDHFDQGRRWSTRNAVLILEDLITSGRIELDGNLIPRPGKIAHPRFVQITTEVRDAIVDRIKLLDRPQLETRSITLKLIPAKMRTEEEKMEIDFIDLNINYGSAKK